MAMKIKPPTAPVNPVPEKPEPDTQPTGSHALVEKADTSPTQFLNSLADLCTATPGSDTQFPTVKLLWAIEAQNSDTYDLEDSGKLLLTTGGAYEVLAPGTIFTLIASRNTIRKLVTDDTGKKDYHRAYAQVGNVQSASHATYVSNCSNPDWQTGIATLVGVITPDGRKVIAEWQMFKADTKYFGTNLNANQLHAKLGLKITCPNHMKNLKANKAGTGSYLDAKKFTQHESVQLSDDQVREIAELVVDKQKMFSDWLAR